MAHEIYDDRFLSRQKPAWHGLGETFPVEEELTLTDAFSQARLDYTVKRCQTGFQLGAKQKWYKNEGNFQIVRLPQGEEDPVAFGSCSSRYEPLQNMAVAAAVDETLRGRYPVETCGALKEGSKVFFTLRGGEYAVKNVDEIRSYYLGSISHKPGESNGLYYTPVRVVCWNTEQLAKSVAEVKLSIPHTGDPEALLRFGLTLIEGMVNSEETTQLIFEAMASTKVTLEQVTKVVNSAFPSTPKPKMGKIVGSMSDEALQRLAENENTAKNLKSLAAKMKRWQNYQGRLEIFREAALERYQAFESQAVDAYGTKARILAGTAWAAYNAVTEVTNWRQGRSEESIAEAVLFGDRAAQSESAFLSAAQMAKVPSLGISNN